MDWLKLRHRPRVWDPPHRKYLGRVPRSKASMNQKVLYSEYVSKPSRAKVLSPCSVLGCFPPVAPWQIGWSLVNTDLGFADGCSTLALGGVAGVGVG